MYFTTILNTTVHQASCAMAEAGVTLGAHKLSASATWLTPALPFASCQPPIELAVGVRFWYFSAAGVFAAEKVRYKRVGDAFGTDICINFLLWYKITTLFFRSLLLYVSIRSLAFWGFVKGAFFSCLFAPLTTVFFLSFSHGAVFAPF